MAIFDQQLSDINLTAPEILDQLKCFTSVGNLSEDVIAPRIRWTPNILPKPLPVAAARPVVVWTHPNLHYPSRGIHWLLDYHTNGNVEVQMSLLWFFGGGLN